MGGEGALSRNERNDVAADGDDDVRRSGVYTGGRMDGHGEAILVPYCLFGMTKAVVLITSSCCFLFFNAVSLVPDIYLYSPLLPASSRAVGFRTFMCVLFMIFMALSSGFFLRIILPTSF